jgi:hypothetical protein
MKRQVRHMNDDAFDENGLLKDGHKYIAPMRAMDHRIDDAGPMRIVDGFGRGGLALNRPGFRKLNDECGDYHREKAYRAYDQQLCDAYKQDAPPAGSYPYTAAAEGSACTVDGRPGTLVKQGNWLVCKPDEEGERTASDRRSVKQMTQDHQDRMESIYHQLDLELQGKWRG